MQRLDDRSRMSGDVHVRFCESLRGKFPRATRLLILCGSEGEGIQSKGETDHAQKHRAESCGRHPQVKSGAAWVCELLQDCELQERRKGVDELDTPSTARHPDETVEEAVAAASQTATVGLSTAVQMDQDA